MLLIVILLCISSAQQIYFCQQNYISKYDFLKKRNLIEMVERSGFHEEEIEAACSTYELIPAQVIEENLYSI